MGKPVLTDFYTDWCGPCKQVAPILEELKRRFGDRVEIRKIDLDPHDATEEEREELREYALKFQIQFVPTLVIEKDGEMKERLVGVQPLEKLEELLSRLVD